MRAGHEPGLERWRRLLPFVPPVVFYSLSALGAAWFTDGASASLEAQSSIAGSYLYAVIATAFSSLFLYLLYAVSASEHHRLGVANPFTASILVAVSAALVVAMSVPRWLPLLGVLVHLVVQRRRWLLIVAEYGATALGLAWFFAAFEGRAILPWGVPVALIQGALLWPFHAENTARRPVAPQEGDRGPAD
ncbi:MAG: hypothetical protein DWQ36_16930 [Acidobacteria bacterium]|nr:MAG: hypothetical protein DWQ30_05025 [Acidobacteriota bacterium]REK04535.1 MAG: hypothetical protein DWQ36_16930 [Acidobacteriota bacterium]